jgi:hypothetical protein
MMDVIDINIDTSLLRAGILGRISFSNKVNKY